MWLRTASIAGLRPRSSASWSIALLFNLRSTARVRIGANARMDPLPMSSVQSLNRRVLGSIPSTGCSEPVLALWAELGAGRSLLLALGTLHAGPPNRWAGEGSQVRRE